MASNDVDAQRSIVVYDIYVSKRLDRVRLLVRAGPGLGLMGTLIPLSPALAALGNGNAQVLADELQTAFAITVVGVAIGLIAFTVALFHERFYSRDLADLEYLRELRSGEFSAGQPAPTTPAPATPNAPIATPQPASGTAAPVPVPVPVPAPVPTPGAPAAPAQAGQPAGKKFGIRRKQPAQTAPPTPPSAGTTQFAPPAPATGQPHVMPPAVAPSPSVQATTQGSSQFSTPSPHTPVTPEPPVRPGADKGPQVPPASAPGGFKPPSGADTSAGKSGDDEDTTTNPPKN